MARQLRDYQTEGLEGLRSEIRAGARRVIYWLPTGGGKTTVASAMIGGSVARGRRALFLAHRRELIVQAADRLVDEGLDVGIVMGNHPRANPQAPVQVASVQTLARRKDHPPAQLIVVDECHRTLGASYLRLLEEVYPEAHVVGLSATPYRTDGRGLGDYYQGLVRGPTVRQLTDRGFLVPLEIFAPPIEAMLGRKASRSGDYTARDLEKMNKPALVGDVVGHWLRLGEWRPTVVFACSVEHSQHLAQQFEARGVPARHLDGRTPAAERDQILQDLQAGTIRLVVNCGVLTEGWDQPSVSCAVVARPTLSLGLWRQMAGRILRPAPGKKDALLLDHGGCTRIHGHVYLEEEVDLKGVRAGAQGPKKKGPTVAQCSSCYGVMAGRPDACPYCGARMQQQKVREIEHRTGHLEKVAEDARPLIARPRRDRAMAKARELVKTAQIKGYKPGWVRHRLRAIYGQEYAQGLLQEVGNG